MASPRLQYMAATQVQLRSDSQPAGTGRQSIEPGPPKLPATQISVALSHDVSPHSVLVGGGGQPSSGQRPSPSGAVQPMAPAQLT